MEFYHLSCPDGSMIVLKRDEVLSVKFEGIILTIKTRTDRFDILVEDSKKGEELVQGIVVWLNEV
jgi:hypothetical protein